MKVGIRLGVCNNPPTDLLQDVRWFPVIIIHHPPIMKNVQQNRGRWAKMAENG